MKLKKILAGVIAAAMALTTMAATSFTASAAVACESQVLSPWSEEKIADLVIDDNNTTVNGISLAAWGSQWVKCYDPAISGLAGDDTVYIKLNVKNVTDCGGTSFDDLLTVDDQDAPWVIFANINNVQVKPVIGSSSESAGAFLPFSNVTIDEWGGIGFNIQAGHVGFELVSAEVVKVFEYSDTPEDITPPEDVTPPAEDTSSAIWEGSTDMGTSWGSNVSVNNIKAEAEDELVIHYTIGTAAEYQQVKIMDGSWAPLTAPVTNDYDCVELGAGTSSYKVVLNENDAAALTSGGLVISGYNVTVTKIELIPASGGNEDSSGESDKEEDKDNTDDKDEDINNDTSDTAVRSVISSVTIPANSITKFEITDPVTGDSISTSVNKLAKALRRITEGSTLEFDVGSFGLILRKNVIQAVVDNDLTLVINTSKATFIIDAENIAKVKTVNIAAIQKTNTFKELVKEGDLFNVIISEKNKVEIELA